MLWLRYYTRLSRVSLWMRNYFRAVRLPRSSAARKKIISSASRLAAIYFTETYSSWRNSFRVVSTINCLRGASPRVYTAGNSEFNCDLFSRKLADVSSHCSADVFVAHLTEVAPHTGQYPWIKDSRHRMNLEAVPIPFTTHSNRGDTASIRFSAGRFLSIHLLCVRRKLFQWKPAVGSRSSTAS